jgi:hypothetical protein
VLWKCVENDSLYDEDPEDEGVPAVELEIAARYHLDLLDWVERLAYLKRDAETYDQARADRAEARFIRTFGERPNTANLQRLLRGAPRRSRGHWL